MLSVSLLLALKVVAAPVIHVHTAGDASFNANSYLVETADGVVAVDAPFTVSEARAFRRELDALGKPLRAVLVTHAHPDHVNGITELVAGQNVPVIALASVADSLRKIDGPKRAYWTPIVKDDYPKTTTFPDRIVKDGEAVTVAGVTFRAHDLGPGESDSETVWVLEGKAPVAFVGDLVMHKVHPWLVEAHSGAWLAALARGKRLLAKDRVATIYPGHGETGTLAALDWQKRYLDAYRAAVRALAAGKPTLDAEAKAKLQVRMEAFLPGAKLAILIGMSADPVAAELVTK